LPHKRNQRRTDRHLIFAISSRAANQLSTTDTLELDTDVAAPSRISVAGLARNGAIAGVIKLMSAGLSFAMFVAVALVTDERSSGFLQRDLCGCEPDFVLCECGGSKHVLRFWPQYASVGNVGVANSYMARAILTTLSDLASSLASLRSGCCRARSPNAEWLPLCLSASLLSFALAGRSSPRAPSGQEPADLGAVAARRDLARAVDAGDRRAVPAAWNDDAVTATLITAGLLFLSMAPQAFILLRDTWRTARTPLTSEQSANSIRDRGLWGRPRCRRRWGR